MLKQNTTLITLLFLFGTGCADSEKVSPKTQTTFSYRGASHYGMGSSEMGGVDACSLSGPTSHVVIATLRSSQWEKRTCGEKIPDSRFRYTLDVTTNILDGKSGELTILGLERFGALPRGAKAGDTFLIAYKTEKEENILLQWAEIFEEELMTDDRYITLPAGKNELIQDIQKARQSSCETQFIGFKVDALISDWSHRNCGDPTIHPIEVPKISNGVDL